MWSSHRQDYVTLLLTGQILFTVHATPSPALQHARHQYCGLDEDARADEVQLLFLVTDYGRGWSGRVVITRLGGRAGSRRGRS